MSDERWERVIDGCWGAAGESPFYKDTPGIAKALRAEHAALLAVARAAAEVERGMSLPKLHKALRDLRDVRGTWALTDDAEGGK